MIKFILCACFLLCPAVLSDTKIAGRYHLRTRTEGFFDRAVEEQLAGRYHIRKRTKRFFNRSIV